MSEKSRQAAQHFIENETQFHLGFLPTEQSNPLTRTLEKDFAESCIKGVATLQRPDRDVLAMAKKVFASAEYEKLVSTGVSILTGGGKIIFSGCGATGRLSILLESMWRTACSSIPALEKYSNQVFSIMTGGDYALVKSVESFEDYQVFGRRQAIELDINANDMLIAITEGGETSSVLGSLFEALDRGAKAFLMFNNPADILAEHLERSRKAIRDERVCVLDLFCGSMALAGSTRMQATTSEQLIAGCALEDMIAVLLGKEKEDHAADFEKLLDELESEPSCSAIAAFIDFESSLYRKNGLITYFANDFMLDIFTDTTERSPTFMLPSFRKKDDSVSPRPWAFVKNPLFTTEDTWKNTMLRPLRCLEWQKQDYIDMQVPEQIVNNPPLIKAAELLKFEVGNENIADRNSADCTAAVLVTVCEKQSNENIYSAFAECSNGFAAVKHLSVGGCKDADFVIACSLKRSSLDIMGHMAIKLALNTISTGVMAVLGRVTGNWMSWVAVSNKKLIDRAIRLICEIGEVDYTTSCNLLFESVEELEQNSTGSKEQPSVVQYVLKEKLGKR